MLTLATTALTSALALVPGGGSAVAGLSAALGYLLRCRACLLGLAALGIWIAADIHGHQAERVTCDARIAADHQAAETARKQRDDAIAEELGETYRPKISSLEALTRSLKLQVENANKKPVASNGRCRLGPAAKLLRPPPG